MVYTTHSQYSVDRCYEYEIRVPPASYEMSSKIILQHYTLESIIPWRGLQNIKIGPSDVSFRTGIFLQDQGPLTNLFFFLNRKIKFRHEPSSMTVAEYYTTHTGRSLTYLVPGR